MDKFSREYLRSALFGVEDSLVSTTGLVVGITVATQDKKYILLAGFIAIIIEAVSMGAGEYLSDDALNELEKIKRHRDNAMLSGIIMFLTYFIAGLVPLMPIVVISYPYSLYCSIILALTGLFFLGYIKGKILNTNRLKGAFKIFLVGGIATILGIVVGLILKL